MFLDDSSRRHIATLTTTPTEQSTLATLLKTLTATTMPLTSTSTLSRGERPTKRATESTG